MSASEKRTMEEIRKAFKHIHDFAIGHTTRSYMSIPVNKSDADVILWDALDELEQWRKADLAAAPAGDAELAELRELRDMIRKHVGTHPEGPGTTKRKLEFLIEQAETHYLNRPHTTADECPSYYDGCNCTVESLEDNIKRADEAEQQLQAERARADAEEHAAKVAAASCNTYKHERDDLKRRLEVAEADNAALYRQIESCCVYTKISKDLSIVLHKCRYCGAILGGDGVEEENIHNNDCVLASPHPGSRLVEEHKKQVEGLKAQLAAEQEVVNKTFNSIGSALGWSTGADHHSYKVYLLGLATETACDKLRYLRKVEKDLAEYKAGNEVCLRKIKKLDEQISDANRVLSRPTTDLNFADDVIGYFQKYALSEQKGEGVSNES